MGWTGDPVWLADVLRAEGLTVVEMPGWKDRGHGDFGWIWGSMYHHTGSNNTSAEFCARGRSDLPGPICNVHVNRQGVMTIVAAGVAWHGGSGSYKDIPVNAANWHTIGFEVQYDGTNITNAQREAMVKAMAAISRKIQRSATSSVVGHKEYSNMGKWDPGNVDMNLTRDQVRRQIMAGPGRVVTGSQAPVDHARDAWTLTGDEYYGPLSGPDNSISGMYGEPQYKMRSLRVFQETVDVPVTGVYDAATRDAARAVQRRNKIYGWGQVSRATFLAALKEKEMSTNLEHVFNSRVAGSSWKGPLWEHIVNGNAHAYDSKVASEKCEKELAEVRKELAEIRALLKEGH
ncbi:N-acetylmuramoyl-L-alanine amidase [Corynebacterium aurimucosum]|uniref:peptidoglycan recognition protein family protein n=1 Tax=Corynebacterium aurimucosum TaxID=169292 RepID=UPI001C0F1AC7|nr:N-acetylmuramoyl-L-alanine amidase [Corynebacterium aurimucosum]MBU5654533.1 N-acetylmuramoyl-L-alanine amidase [Corynebacterium aurimucosum]